MGLGDPHVLLGRVHAQHVEAEARHRLGQEPAAATDVQEG